MKMLALAVLVFSTLSFQLSFAGNFPSAPIRDITPGKLCDLPLTTRYPEQIPYCGRDVSPALKRIIIEQYDMTFGFKIESMPREQFKIDHYIPLCMGGSNDISNLWPQHESIYMITDALEAAVCEKMAEGKILQKDAVQIIILAKNNLREVPKILSHIHAL